jgi:F-type H+-transporting ATPase subunit a
LVCIPVIAGAVAINGLELFVAFLQAYIFTFLTAMFLGQAVDMHHDEDHGDEAGHAEVAH